MEHKDLLFKEGMESSTGLKDTALWRAEVSESEVLINLLCLLALCSIFLLTQANQGLGCGTKSKMRSLRCG